MKLSQNVNIYLCVIVILTIILIALHVQLFLWLFDVLYSGISSQGQREGLSFWGQTALAHLKILKMNMNH